MIRLFFVLSLFFITACNSILHTPRIKANNICNVLDQHRSWNQSLENVEKNWGVEKNLVLAFIHQESRFQSNARPGKDAHIANNTPSNAYGFAQVKKETWEWYQFKVQNHHGVRDNFHDAIDFIGWYINVSTKRLNISKRDVLRQYLAYHEGHGGFERKTFIKKPWLIAVAKKVSRKAQTYKKQLRNCDR